MRLVRELPARSGLPALFEADPPSAKLAFAARIGGEDVAFDPALFLGRQIEAVEVPFHACDVEGDPSVRIVLDDGLELQILPQESSTRVRLS